VKTRADLQEATTESRRSPTYRDMMMMKKHEPTPQRDRENGDELPQ
jgi:hypothetical protein